MKVSIFLLILFALLLGATRISHAAAVEAWLDRTQVAEGDSVQLTLEAHGQVDGQPDTAPLRRDFDILGTSTGSRLSIVNGRSDASTQWILTLSPRHSGEIEIPSLRVGAAKSPPLQLRVSRSPAPGAAAGADIFIETTLQPRQPYVQQQVIYTQRLLHSMPIDSGQLSEPKPDNVLVRRLGDDRQYATTRNGRRYQVLERRYALFAQHSGRLTLAAPVFSGEVADSRSNGATDPWQRFFGNGSLFGRSPFSGLLAPTRRVHIRGEATGLSVRARPAQAPAATWLPAQGLTLQAYWQPQNAQVIAGEPVTLVLDIEARGLTGGQLPDLAPAAAPGFKVYPDQAQRKTEDGANGVIGHLQQRIAFIPQQSGEFTLPAVRMQWWDTGADAPRVAEVPPRRVQVTAAAAQTPAAAAGQPPPAPATAAPAPASRPEPAAVPVAPSARPVWQVGFWPWISALLAAGWLLTLIYGWRRRTRQQPPAPTGSAARPEKASAARHRFLAACRADDATGARRALLDWAALHWPEDPPAGLQALAGRLPEPTARAALVELDRTLYKGAVEWSGATLAQQLTRLPRAAADAADRGVRLAPLYPGTSTPAS